MSNAGSFGDQNTLAQTQAMIAELQGQIEQLHLQLENERFSKLLRVALITAATAGIIASPTTHSRLLEMIVETAAHILSARAASLFLIDKHRQELTFEVALGQKAEEVKKFRVPLGHGIAGLVAMSGQPIAVSDAKHDPRQASDVAKAIGYEPQNILCVPLICHDRVIGVLELLDKEGGSSFSINDMTALSLFANQAAVAIEQSRIHETLVPLIVQILQSSGGAQEQSTEEFQQKSLDYILSVEEGPAYHNAIDFARLVHDIARQGEDELKMCYAILSSFADYLATRPKSTSELGWL